MPSNFSLIQAIFLMAVLPEHQLNYNAKQPRKKRIFSWIINIMVYVQPRPWVELLGLSRNCQTVHDPSFHSLVRSLIRSLTHPLTFALVGKCDFWRPILRLIWTMPRNVVVVPLLKRLSPLLFPSLIGFLPLLAPSRHGRRVVRISRLLNLPHRYHFYW